MSNTKKFWCHYIGSDGNTPKRRNIELTDIHELLPLVSNDGAETPLWYEHEDGYYILYAQLSDKVAVRIPTWHTISSHIMEEYLLKTDEDIDREYDEKMTVIYGPESMRYHPMTPEKVTEGKASWRRIFENRKKYRDDRYAELRRFQDYANYLLEGRWVNIATIRAFKEAGSGYCPLLEIQRNELLAQREAEAKAEQEACRKEREEEARRKAEAEASEQERLTQEAEKFKAGESISGCDVVDLCRRYGIDIHLRTVHNLQQVVATINGKDQTCQYYRTCGKRRPQLDGCYKTAAELYQYLQNNPTNQ